MQLKEPPNQTSKRFPLKQNSFGEISAQRILLFVCGATKGLTQEDDLAALVAIPFERLLYKKIKSALSPISETASANKGQVCTITYQ